MKRIIAILAALILFVLVPAFGAAESSPLASYDDEMIQLMCSVFRAELLRRAGEPFDVLPGIYVVGVDIPVMAYRVEPPETGLASADFYRSMEDLYNYFPFHTVTFLDGDPEAIGRVYLTEGFIVEVRYHAVRFVPYTGIE